MCGLQQQQKKNTVQNSRGTRLHLSSQLINLLWLFLFVKFCAILQCTVTVFSLMPLKMQKIILSLFNSLPSYTILAFFVFLLNPFCYFSIKQTRQDCVVCGDGCNESTSTAQTVSNFMACKLECFFSGEGAGELRRSWATKFLCKIFHQYTQKES